MHGPLGLQQGFTLARPYDCAPADELFLKSSWIAACMPNRERLVTSLHCLVGRPGGALSCDIVICLPSMPMAKPLLRRAWRHRGHKTQIRTKVEKAKYPIIIDPLVVTAAEAYRPGRRENDRFGAVAVSGDCRVVAALGQLCRFSEAGAVYVFPCAPAPPGHCSKPGPDPTAFAEFATCRDRGVTPSPSELDGVAPGKMFAGAVYTSLPGLRRPGPSNKSRASGRRGGLSLRRRSWTVPKYAGRGLRMGRRRSADRVGAGCVSCGSGPVGFNKAAFWRPTGEPRQPRKRPQRFIRHTTAPGAPGVIADRAQPCAPAWAGYIFVS